MIHPDHKVNAPKADDPMHPWHGKLHLDVPMAVDTMRGIGTAPTHLLTVAIGDLNGTGGPDAVTGGMHISRPYDRIGRITAWLSK